VSLHNARGINVERTEEYVAAFEVPVTRKQEQSSAGNWHTDHTRFDKYEDYEATIWLGYEWDAYDPDEDSKA